MKVWLILNVGDRSMVYLEGEASMRKFQKADEAEQQALSIIQRSSLNLLFPHPLSRQWETRF